jgi:hypothetical protein
MKGSNLGFELNSGRLNKSTKTISHTDVIDIRLDCDEEITLSGQWTENVKATILTFVLFIISLLLGVWYVTGSNHEVNTVSTR